MRKSGPSPVQTRAATAHIRSRDTAEARLAIEPLWLTFLREQHPQGTAKEVARAINGSPATVKKWLAGESEPNRLATCALISASGPELAALMMPWCAWIARAAREERLAACDARMAAERERRALIAAESGVAP